VHRHRHHRLRRKDFYSLLEHPYPPLFSEMIANAYYPECNDTALSGMSLPDSCGEKRMMGSDGCFSFSSIGRPAGIEVFETSGHVGLPDQWAWHLQQAKPRKVLRRTEPDYSLCGTSKTLREVDPKLKLVIPTVYVICISSDEDKRITEAMVHEQNRWANEAYSGGSPWQRMDFDNGHPEAVNMQIEFNLTEIRYVTDPACAKGGFTWPGEANKYNKKPLEELMIVVITDDHSGTLGQSAFPDSAPENSPEQIITVSASGFRKYPSMYQTKEMIYDEGDTVVHEVGHGLGLKHTFDGGCGTWGNGDWIDDTNPESMPHYTCRNSMSCGEGDPVHNFMDYTPDTCMVGFTEGQKRRAWCMLENYRNTLFRSSLRHTKSWW